MTLRGTAAQIRRFGGQYRGFDPAIGRFLASTLVSTLGMQIMWLYANFYLQALGQDAAFIGLFNAVPNVIALLLGLLVGLASDRIGPRRAFLIGIATLTLGLAGMALSTGAVPILLWACVQGVGNAFLFANGGPFMMAHTRSEQRSAAFSLQSALGNATGFVGNLAGGYLPLLIALGLGVGPESVPALRGVLWVAVALTALSALPLLSVPDAPTAPADPPVESKEAAASATRTGRRALFSRPGLVARLLLPGTLVGLGAGMNMPVLNLFVQGRFGIDFNELGLVFALSSVGTMVATLLQPVLAAHVGRVRSCLLVQALSLPFLIVMGFAPVFPLVVVALVLRGALMNMSNPIYFAFALEQMPDGERARFSSLDSMLWGGGWALGSAFSGWWRDLVGFDAGFNTTFALMAISYAASFVLLWWWFDRPEAAARRNAKPQPASLGA